MILAPMTAAELTDGLVKLADPWSKLYAHSKSVSAAVLFFHLAPLVFAAGTAFVADRATLRAAKTGGTDRSRHLQELAATHRIVVFGLTLSVISGLLMFLSDVENFLGSIFFWIKLALVALLLLNGLLILRTESGLARRSDNSALWARLRTLAVLSMFLWLATTLAGVVLKEFA
jgi:hypothetical protein